MKSALPKSSMLTAFLLTGTDDRRMMIGFSVPKKQVPGAVDRNRIKRLMRESVRKNIHELKTAASHKTGGARIVVMFRRHKSTDLRRLSLHDIEPSWHDLHRRILEAL